MRIWQTTSMKHSQRTTTMLLTRYVSTYGKWIVKQGLNTSWRQLSVSVRKNFETDNVFLFVPNIIDYVRGAFIGLFMYHAWMGNPQAATLCYVLNFALDEVDGNCARYFGQTLEKSAGEKLPYVLESSNFGMMLDIYLDEASVCSLCMVLSVLYPQYIIVFQLYSIFDFVAQWSNYYYSAMHNNNKYSVSSDPIINTYFNCYVLNLLWVYGNHVFLMCLYNCYYFTGPVLSLFGASIGLWKLLAFLAAPWSISRLLIMIYLLFTSMRNLGNQDYLRRIASKSKSQANTVCRHRMTITRITEMNKMIKVAGTDQVLRN